MPTPTIDLPSRAVTVDKHGTIESFPAQVTADAVTGEPVLAVVGTPGRWRLTDLADLHPGAMMAIDFGQRWGCTNITALVAEAKAAIAQEDAK